MDANTVKYFDTPILILIYNRAEPLKKLAEVLKLIRPERLYISADGPKQKNVLDQKKCSEARKVFEETPYSNQTFYNYLNENKGCKDAIIDGITWFFNNEPEGIILESDTIPHPSFFKYCSSKLENHKHDDHIKLICGTNYLFKSFLHKKGSFLSPFAPIWGWATWKNFWLEFLEDNEKYEMSSFSEIHSTFNNYLFTHWIYKMIIDSYDGNSDAWSPLLADSIIKRKGFGVIPYQNLVSNVGNHGTHTKKGLKHLFLKCMNLIFNSKQHSSLLMPTYEYQLIDETDVVIDNKAFETNISNVNNIVFGNNFSQKCFEFYFKFLRS